MWWEWIATVLILPGTMILASITLALRVCSCAAMITDSVSFKSFSLFQPLFLTSATSSKCSTWVTPCSCLSYHKASSCCSLPWGISLAYHWAHLSNVFNDLCCVFPDSRRNNLHSPAPWDWIGIQSPIVCISVSLVYICFYRDVCWGLF